MKNFMNVTLLLRMVQKIGNSLIAFSPVLTRMSVAQIYGTGFTPSLKKTMALAGLMSLASVGAYASTKSAAEGEVNTPVEALIPMAQDFIKNNNIDVDNSGTINYEFEQNRLLTGTTTNTIEDLITKDINKKLTERNAEKIFTTFMTTNNQEQAEKNIDILNSGKDYIAETYDKMVKNFDSISNSMDSTETLLIDLFLKLYYAEDVGEELKQESLNALEKFHSEFSKIYTYLKDTNKEYENITTQVFTPILNKQESYERDISYIEEQMQKIDTISTDKMQVVNEIGDFLALLRDDKEEFSICREQYKYQKENDIALLKMLLQQQTEFNEDGKSSAEEQAASKDL